jgi:hypothetical protein
MMMMMQTTNPTRPALDESKFRELLLYIAEESVGDSKFGKTKLNKILFYVDFLAYGIFGRPVTGATYQRRPYGPVPREISYVRNSLLESGEAEVQYVERFGLTQERLIAKRPPNLSLFTQAEKQHVDAVIRALWNRNGIEASELSHREPGWKLARERQTIPYEAVFLSPEDLTPDDIDQGQRVWAKLQAA